jgi:hypothetical protein
MAVKKYGCVTKNKISKIYLFIFTIIAVKLTHLAKLRSANK